MSFLKVSHKELVELYVHAEDDKVQAILKYMKDKYNLNKNLFAEVRNKLQIYFVPVLQKKLKKSRYVADHFSKNNSKWLTENFEIPLASPVIKRQSIKDFDTCSTKTKRRRINEVIQQIPRKELEKIVQRKYDCEDSALGFDENNETNVGPKNNMKFTRDEALALLLDAQLSKFQYNLIKKKIEEKNIHIFPSYNEIINAKKDCYPTDIKITETEASVNLQSILNHTSERLLKSLDVNTLPQEGDLLTLTSKYGCDETSGLSLYKQAFEDSKSTDEYIFILHFVPIFLNQNSENLASAVVWQNPKPSSTKLCRPLKFDFVKESKEKILLEIESIKKEIEKLRPSEVEVSGKKFRVKHNLLCTMVDGKVCQALTDTSSSNCTICKATPKEMNDLEKVKERVVNISAYQYGLQTLHAWIRFMECVLHVSYRIAFKKWICKDIEHKELLKKSKTQIQNELRKKLGILVDVTKQGCGSTNDGNTARIFFRNFEVVSEITGFDKDLIKKFYVILQVLASGDAIDTNQI